MMAIGNTYQIVWQFYGNIYKYELLFCIHEVNKMNTNETKPCQISQFVDYLNCLGYEYRLVECTNELLVYAKQIGVNHYHLSVSILEFARMYNIRCDGVSQYEGRTMFNFSYYSNKVFE
jgi:hypothetical protein